MSYLLEILVWQIGQLASFLFVQSNSFVIQNLIESSLMSNHSQFLNIILKCNLKMITYLQNLWSHFVDTGLFIKSKLNMKKNRYENFRSYRLV